MYKSTAMILLLHVPKFYEFNSLLKRLQR